MIVLGEKYTFTTLEIEQLKKKKKQLVTLSYHDSSVESIIAQLKILTKSHKIIVLNTKAPVSDKLIKYLTELDFQGIRYYTIEFFLEKYLYKCYIANNHTDLHYLVDIKPFSRWQYIQKRIMDYIGVVSIYVLTFPIIYYSRRRIKKESPGTSMFKQTRIGLNGKAFKCLKFRSMSLDAEKDGVKFASKNDPRVFPWGKKMRKTRIDELPQLINVLRGEMHLIAPRPERKVWIDKFEETIPYYNQRHIIRPGITGWAQVMYPYGVNSKDARQKLMYDLYYIKHWSLLLDFKILWKTFFVVFGKKGI